MPIERNISDKINDSYELPNNVIKKIPDPLVSVRTSTYQHKDYIKECIESILMQKVNFSYEFIIGEDFSTDGTREIVFEYANRYPDLIRVITADRNVGAKANSARCRPAIRGKYVAICEGDDYWVDPCKLQKQVDFLEANPDYGMVCNDYNKLYMKSGILEKNCFPAKYINSGRVEFEEYLLDRTSICTATVMLRMDILEKYYLEIHNNELSSWNVGDTPMWLYFAVRSNIKVLNDVTAVYRINIESASKTPDIEKHYQFIKKGYEIPDFFISKYGVSLQTMKLIKHGRSNIELQFSCRRKKLLQVLKWYLYIIKKHGFYKTDLKILINFIGLGWVLKLQKRSKKGEGSVERL